MSKRNKSEASLVTSKDRISIDDIDDDVAILWEQLQAKQRNKMQRLEDETVKLQTEKDTMLDSIAAKNSDVRDDDIIIINAGGVLITAMRSTLTAPIDSMWSYMFSGRWEESLTRDKDGNIFLDYDDELIKIIVNYLREKKIEDPSDPVTCPIIPQDKTKSFQRLIQYFGLTEFLYPSSLHCFVFSKNHFLEHDGESFVTVTEDETNKIKLVYASTQHYHCGAFSTELDPSGGGVFWKMKIEKIPRNWIFVGITGNLDLPDSVWNDNQAYGWTGNYKYVKGNRIGQCNGWAQFLDGESLYFSFKSNQFKIHRVRIKKTFVIDDVTTSPTTKFYFHIGFDFRDFRGTTVTLESLNAEERAIFD